MQVYYDQDADLSRVRDRKVTVLGYGSQGHAHATNLRDSGVDVVVGLRRDSASWAKAADAGLTVMETAEAVRAGDVVMVLLPDELQGDVYREAIQPGLEPGNYLAFGHGFNIHFELIEPRAEVPQLVVNQARPALHGLSVQRQRSEGLQIERHDQHVAQPLFVFGICRDAGIEGRLTAQQAVERRMECRLDVRAHLASSAMTLRRAATALNCNARMAGSLRFMIWAISRWLMSRANR